MRKHGLEPDDGACEDVGDRDIKISKLFRRNCAPVRHRRWFHRTYNSDIRFRRRNTEQQLGTKRFRTKFNNARDCRGKDDRVVHRQLRRPSFSFRERLQTPNRKQNVHVPWTKFTCPTADPTPQGPRVVIRLPSDGSSVAFSDTASFVSTRSKPSPVPTCPCGAGGRSQYQAGLVNHARINTPRSGALAI